MTARMTQDEMVKRLTDATDGKLTLLSHIRSRILPVGVQCNDCGFKFQCSLANFSCNKSQQGEAGCPICLGSRISSAFGDLHNQFIAKVNKLLPDRYLKIMILGRYLSSSTKIVQQCIGCSNVWSSSANNILGDMAGCPECSAKGRIGDHQRSGRDSVIARANAKYPDIEVLEAAESLNGTSKFRHTCGHEWSGSVQHLLYQVANGCPACERRQFVTVDSLRQRVAEMHSGTILFDQDTYLGSMLVYHKWKCTVCECRWESTPANVVSNGHGCPECNRPGSKGSISQVQVEWLTALQEFLAVPIRFGEKEKRLTLPSGRRAYVDGYCKDLNAVFEFHGTCWHGDLRVYAPDHLCHPFNKELTAKQLYDATIEREDAIRELGYEVISMWEKDYRDHYWLYDTWDEFFMKTLPEPFLQRVGKL